MKKITIYHNPRCSKSRETLSILQGKKIDLKIIEYLKTPLTESQIKTLLKQLQLKPITRRLHQNLKNEQLGRKF